MIDELRMVLDSVESLGAMGAKVFAGYLAFKLFHLVLCFAGALMVARYGIGGVITAIAEAVNGPNP